jgi:hypothetical protein
MVPLKDLLSQGSLSSRRAESFIEPTGFRIGYASRMHLLTDISKTQSTRWKCAEGAEKRKHASLGMDRKR